MPSNKEECDRWEMWYIWGKGNTHSSLAEKREKTPTGRPKRRKLYNIK
jgi:hypothetical protein